MPARHRGDVNDDSAEEEGDGTAPPTEDDCTYTLNPMKCYNPLYYYKMR